ncbi:unnamed protein product [Allacma fusca]|uniref:MADF domain-containing protein n=1 Tax=Allacma fusca TaxID=39272 RepID=A0A8J2KHJ9_9HEXA|nr:unnamed protein product [Allacma fusca]
MSRKRTARASKAEFEQKIIEEVKKRPFLYKKQHPDHKNALIVANAWKRIFEELGENSFTASGPECADMWSSLWSQFLGFKRRVAGSTGKAGGKRPTFRHEFAMREFDDKEYEENTMSNVSDLNDDEEPETSEVEVVFNNNGEIQVSTTPSPTSGDESSSNQSFFKGRTHEKSKKRMMTDFEQEMVNMLKTTEPEKDEFELFGNTIAAKLRKISARDESSASHLQFGIFDLIYTTEKDLLR